jgi:hypothetical protein
LEAVIEGRYDMPKPKQIKKKRLTRVSVTAERREDVDWDRFAWALLQYARVLAEGEESQE